MIKYRIHVLDIGNGEVIVVRRNLTASTAWKLINRYARRGFKLYGGEIVRNNWGMRGGDFPLKYRYAVIQVDRC